MKNQFFYPGFNARRPADAARRHEQEPRQALLLRRLRISSSSGSTPASSSRGCRPTRCATATSATRRRSAPAASSTPCRAIVERTDPRPTRSIRAAGDLMTRCRGRTPTRRRPAATTTSTTCWSIRTAISCSGASTPTSATPRKLFVRYNMQRETQPFVIGLWWRNGERQLPYPSPIEAHNQSDSVTASLTKILSPSLTNEIDHRGHLHRFPQRVLRSGRVSRPALGYPYRGVFGSAIRSRRSTGSGGPTIFNPGGFDPVLFATKWQFAALNNVTKVSRHAHAEGRLLLRARHQQSAGQRQQQRQLVSVDTTLSQSTGNAFADLLLGRIGSYNEQTRNALHNIGYNRWELFAQDTWRYRSGLTFDFGARFSYIGPWYDREGRGLVAWDPSRSTTRQPSGRRSRASSGTRSTAAYRRPASSPDFFIQPRVGVAWDLSGTGETVLAAASASSSRTTRSSRTRLDRSGVRGEGLQHAGRRDDAAGARGIGPKDADRQRQRRLATDTKQPTTYSWSSTVNQKLPWAMMLELGYVGNKSTDLMNFDLANYNAVPLGAMLNDPEGDANRYRPFPKYGSFNVFRHSMYQNYHARSDAAQPGELEVRLHGAYTYSKTLGVRSGDRGSRTGARGRHPRSSVQLRRARHGSHARGLGRLQLPVRRRRDSEALRGRARQLAGHGHHAVHQRRAAERWRPGNFDIQGTLADGSGDQRDAHHRIAGRRVQPALTCDPREDVPRRSGAATRACFAAPSVGPNGNYVFPDLRGPGYINHDFVDLQELPDGRRRQVPDPRRGTNVFNHPQRFSTTTPEPDAASSTTGRQTNATSASCRTTTRSDAASSSSPSRCISSSSTPESSPTLRSGHVDEGSASAGPLCLG